jgi:hypothetical protein
MATPIPPPLLSGKLFALDQLATENPHLNRVGANGPLGRAKNSPQFRCGDLFDFHARQDSGPTQK